MKRNKKLLPSFPLVFLKEDMSLSIIQLDLGAFETPQNEVKIALAMAQKNSERSYEGEIWILMGRIKGKKKPAEFDKAEEQILKGIKLAEEFKLKPYISRGYLYLGDLYNDRVIETPVYNYG